MRANADSSELLGRGEWLRELVLETLPSKDEPWTWPAPALVLDGRPKDAAATIVTGVAVRHQGGWLLDAIVGWLKTPGILAERGRALSAALASIEAFRSGRFPDVAWWDSEQLHFAALSSWADQFAGTSTEPQAIEIVAELFELVEGSREIRKGLYANPRPLNELFEAWADRDDAVPTLIEEGRAAASQALGTLHPFARRNRDLAAATHAAVVLHLTLRVLEADRKPSSQTAEICAEFVSAIREALQQWFDTFTPLEVTFLRGLDDDDRLLREAVGFTKKMYHFATLTSQAFSRVVVNGLPDRYGGETLEADWLRKEVFGGGARSGLCEWGPTAYAWIAFESHELAADREINQIGFALAEGPTPVTLLAVLQIDEGEPVYMNYWAGHTRDSLQWLAMLVLSGDLLFDVFRIEGNALRLVARLGTQVPEVVAAVRGASLDALRGLDFAELRLPELDNHVVGGFLASENSKSEFLLQLGERDDSTAVAAARRTLLDAEVDRGHALHAEEDPSPAEERVHAAKRVFAELRSARPVRDSAGTTPTSDERMQQLVGGLATESRAFVHYNFDGEHITGFWALDDGAVRGWLEGPSNERMGELFEAIEPWLAGQGGDVASLLAAGASVAEELDSALDGTGTREVVVMPWALLHSLPFAALPLGGKTLGDKYRVSYAPSVGLLRRLADPQDAAKSGIAVIASHAGTLAWADAEVASAASVYDDVQIVDDGATRDEVVRALTTGRVVHLAAHGLYRAEDHFATAVAISDGPGSKRPLTAAEIHRDVDLHGTELVLLATCDSGRGLSASGGIELYTGLDGAFIAGGAKAVVSTLWPVHDLASFLFTTNLHVRLAEGYDLADAFSDSVGLLRQGRYQIVPDPSRLSFALSAGSPDWRDRVREYGPTFTEPFYWAPFRLSGAPWLSRPVA